MSSEISVLTVIMLQTNFTQIYYDGFNLTFNFFVLNLSHKENVITVMSQL